MRLRIMIQITDDSYKTLATRDFDFSGLRSQDGAIAAEVSDMSNPAGEAVKVAVRQMASEIQANVVFARMAAEAAEGDDTQAVSE